MAPEIPRGRIREEGGGGIAKSPPCHWLVLGIGWWGSLLRQGTLQEQGHGSECMSSDLDTLSRWHPVELPS